MKIIKYIKATILLLLTFLLGAQTIYAKTEALRFEPLANVIHLSDDAAALTGYSKLGTIEEVYVAENGITKLEDVAIYKNADDVLAWRGLANAVDNIFLTLETEINILSKQIKNHTILEAEYLAKYPGSPNYPYLKSAPVEDIVVSTKTKFVRLHDANNVNREWMMSIDDFNTHVGNGGTLDDLVEKLALPTRPTKISLVEIPANETIRKSIAGPQQWSGMPYQTGGYTQYQILGYGQSNPIPPNWYSQTTDLNSMFP